MIKLKKLLLIGFVLLVSTIVLAEDNKYYVFDKVLSGTFTCNSENDQQNITCYEQPRMFRLLAWIRLDQDGLPSEIGETTLFYNLAYGFYPSSNNSLEHEFGINECRKAVTLVKSNPEKWDLKIGIKPKFNYLVYCEAINQSLMKQYYAEQEL